MSAFFSLFQRTGTLSASNIIDRIHSQLQVHPHDTEGMLSQERIVTGQTYLWYCTRDKASSLPIHLLINGVEIIFAGSCRLTNHQMLAKNLSLPASASDAEIICHAYIFYGKQFAQHLLGDFSFTLFDAKNAELLLVRDHLGVRPLYYHANKKFCLVSDSIEVILAHPDVVTTLDDQVIAEWCINGTAFNQTNTFYASIKKVPKATVLCISSDSIQTHEYWTIDRVQPLVYKREQDYIEKLSELLKTVITGNIDTTYGIGAHSSGGHDSSAIAIMAGRVCKKSGSAFHTYNWCKPMREDDSACHEWEDARKIARMEGFIHHETGLHKDTLKQLLLSHDLAIDGTTLFEYESAVLLQAQQDGVRQIFSGFGGDEVLTTRSRDNHANAIREGRLLYALKRFASEYESEKKLRPLRIAVNYARLVYRTMFPGAVDQHTRIKTEREALQIRCDLVSRDFLKYAENYYRPEAYALLYSISEKQRFMIAHGYHQERLETWAILGRKAGVRHIYPYLDKRIIEFALAIPSTLYFKQGKARYIYLRAIENILPDFLKNKKKLPEDYRAGHFLRMQRENMIDADIQEMISQANSRYIDAKALLEKCNHTAEIEDSHWKERIMPTIAVTNAILALNINKKNLRQSIHN